MLKLKMDVITHQQGLTMHRAKMWQATIWQLYEYTVLTKDQRSNGLDLTMKKLNIVIVLFCPQLVFSRQRLPVYTSVDTVVNYHCIRTHRQHLLLFALELLGHPLVSSTTLLQFHSFSS
jgi:hypothetical protein